MEYSSELMIKCLTCAKTCSHATVFCSDEGIEHLCCSECGKVNLFASVLDTTEKETRGKKNRISVDHAALMERRKSKPFKPYSVNKDYTDGEYLDHPTFGNGYVISVCPPKKMDVLFASERKRLLCGPGSTAAAPKAAESNRKPKAAVKKTGNVVKKKVSPKTEISSTSTTGDKPVKCPKCGSIIHPYNLYRNTKGLIVRCMNCPK